MSEEEKLPTNFIKDKAENRRIEMVWFGGIPEDCSNEVIHVTLKLEFETDLPTSKI